MRPNNYRCSACQEAGHNATTCPREGLYRGNRCDCGADISPSAQQCVPCYRLRIGSAADARRARRLELLEARVLAAGGRRRCSKCRELGHNIMACPLLKLRRRPHERLTPDGKISELQQR